MNILILRAEARQNLLYCCRRSGLGLHARRTKSAGLPHTESGDYEGGGGIHHRIYREYPDASFKTLKPRPPQWEHLGNLGPLIRAEVGDSIRVVFRNNTHLTLTMHPHGLQYTKDSEGALYNDGTARNCESR